MKPLRAETIAHYRIVEPLGAGGMGIVYKAFDNKLQRIVALKVLPAEYVAQQDRRRRFFQEARAASALNHPHILTIYEVGEDDGKPYIAMEFVEGKTLREQIKCLRTPPHWPTRVASASPAARFTRWATRCCASIRNTPACSATLPCWTRAIPKT